MAFFTSGTYLHLSEKWGEESVGGLFNPYLAFLCYSLSVTWVLCFSMRADIFDTDRFLSTLIVSHIFVRRQVQVLTTEYSTSLAHHYTWFSFSMTSGPTKSLPNKISWQGIWHQGVWKSSRAPKPNEPCQCPSPVRSQPRVMIQGHLKPVGYPRG